MAGLRTVCRSVRTRHSPVTRKTSHGSASFLGRPPSSLPRFAASDDGCLARCKPPARLAPVMGLASNRSVGPSNWPDLDPRATLSGPRDDVPGAWLAPPDLGRLTHRCNARRPDLDYPAPDYRSDRFAYLQGYAGGLSRGNLDRMLAKGMDPPLYSAGPANIKI
jgi:hypothetical protein